jgi:hypothetical protein
MDSEKNQFQCVWIPQINLRYFEIITQQQQKKSSGQHKINITERLYLPTAAPSGVSAGQIMPHNVLCNCRGLASLPSRPIGEFTRLR